MRLIQRWSGRNYGLENLRPDASFLPVVEYLRKGVNIRTDWQVTEVNYEDVGRIVLTSAKGEVRANPAQLSSFACLASCSSSCSPLTLIADDRSDTCHRDGPADGVA